VQIEIFLLVWKQLLDYDPDPLMDGLATVMVGIVGLKPANSALGPQWNCEQANHE